MIKLIQAKTGHLLFKVTDLSGTYVHLALIRLAALQHELKEIHTVIPHIKALPDFQVYSNPDITTLVKLEKDVLFKGWEDLTAEKGYCFAEMKEAASGDVGECSADIFRERLNINSEGYFWLTYNTVLDEDGAIMEYETEAYSFGEFLNVEE